jgi:hypothetical protein
MAQRVTVILTDDLDGSDAAETVAFGLDGTSYEIDLNGKNAAKLRDALAKYVGAGRKVSKTSNRGRKLSVTAEAAPAEVRSWALSNGYEVPARGRIPAEARAAYEAAH